MLGTSSQRPDQANPVVVFDDIRYDVIAAPEAGTPLVQRVRTTVSQMLDIDRLARLLERTDDLLYIAACGVAGRVHPKTSESLSARVMGVQYKLRASTSELDGALLSLGESARSMLAILRGAFRDLYSLHEADAVARLVRCAPVAMKMHESARQLAASFRQLAAEANAVVSLATEVFDLHKDEGLEMRDRVRAADEWLETTGLERAPSESRTKQSETLRRQTGRGEITEDERASAHEIALAFGRRLSEASSIETEQPGVETELAAALARASLTYAADARRPAESVSGGLFGTRSGANSPADGSAATTATYADTRSEYVETMIELQKHEYQALQATSRHAAERGSPRHDDDVKQAAVDSLHHSVITLQQIAVILAEHERIWRQVADDYARLAAVDLRTGIETWIQRSEAERIEAYSEPRFQVHMLSMAAQWYALQLIADESRSTIRAAYTKMGRTYTKNPSVEEAHELVPALSAAMARQVAAEIKLLKERAGPRTLEQHDQSIVTG